MEKITQKLHRYWGGKCKREGKKCEL
jgi:hypothetical protein